MDATIVRCCVRARSRIIDITWNDAAESSPDVGSSRNISAGDDTSSTPIDTRRRSPPDTPRMITFPTLESATRSSPRSVITRSTRSPFSALDTEPSIEKSAEYLRFSRTVSAPSSASSCITYAVCRLFSDEFTSSPFTATSPDTPLVTRPARMLSRDDLPAPDGPSSAIISPGRANPDTPRRMCFSPFLVFTR